MLEIIKAPERPLISVFVPFTRDWSLDRFLPSLSSIIIPREETELDFFVDSDNEVLIKRLREYLEEKAEEFNGCKLFVSGNPAPLETNISVQRNRIVGMKEKSKLMISGEYVFGLEDDTLVPPNTFQKLRETIDGDEDIGFVEGVEAGRHGIKMVGAWVTNNIHDPTTQKTLLPPRFISDLIEPITGGGFYCYLTTAYLYKNIKYRYEAECFGPDVCFVMDVCKLGYEAKVDWGLRVIHMTRKADILVDDNIKSIEWHKDKQGNWKLQPYRN